jgi:transcriptional regulator with XRE-family HTH domain
MAVPPNDPIDVALGARLRVLRLRRGLSQADMAVAIGVTFQQVQKYERGANRISASAAARIAARLEVPVAELFGDGVSDSSTWDAVADLLGEPGALPLLEAYSALPHGTARSALVELVTSAGRPAGE